MSETMRMFTLYVVEKETGERIAIRPGLIFEEEPTAGIANRFTIKALNTEKREVIIEAHAFKSEVTESWDKFVKMVADGELKLVNSENVIREMREAREQGKSEQSAKDFEDALKNL
jgi:hypothetical protein